TRTHLHPPGARSASGGHAQHTADARRWTHTRVHPAPHPPVDPSHERPLLHSRPTWNSAVWAGLLAAGGRGAIGGAAALSLDGILRDPRSSSRPGAPGA